MKFNILTKSIFQIDWPSVIHAFGWNDDGIAEFIRRCKTRLCRTESWVECDAVSFQRSFPWGMLSTYWCRGFRVAFVWLPIVITTCCFTSKGLTWLCSIPSRPYVIFQTWDKWKGATILRLHLRHLSCHWLSQQLIRRPQPRLWRCWPLKQVILSRQEQGTNLLLHSQLQDP